jgi:hypothetical protein
VLETSKKILDISTVVNRINFVEYIDAGQKLSHTRFSSFKLFQTVQRFFSSSSVT